ncbi:MAG: xanthine dehydrogenase family protein subunit M [Alphaproteobacteria bacterium]
MKPAPFTYLVAHSLDAALALKAEHGDEARFLAGGQSLVPAMNFRLAQPAALIDLNPLDELDYIQSNGTLRIGALTRHRALEKANAHPLLHEIMPHVAHWPIRTRGTIAGNLAHADPASELPAAMVALGARLKAQCNSGERWIEATDFFTGPLTTALGDDEMLTEVEVPTLPERTGTCFMELARRQGDYAMMGVAAVVTVDEMATCTAARLAYLSAGPTPMLVSDAGLVGTTLDDDAIAAAAETAKAAIDPAGTVHASAAYQRHIAGVLTRRALVKARDRIA